MWQVTISKANKIWNWKAREKNSRCKIPVVGKGFKNEEETLKDWIRFVIDINIKEYERIKEKK